MWQQWSLDVMEACIKVSAEEKKGMGIDSFIKNE